MACSSAQMSAGQSSFGRNSWMKAAKKASVASGHGWYKKGERPSNFNRRSPPNSQDFKLKSSLEFYRIMNQVKQKDDLVLLG